MQGTVLALESTPYSSTPLRQQDHLHSTDEGTENQKMREGKVTWQIFAKPRI